MNRLCSAFCSDDGCFSSHSSHSYTAVEFANGIQFSELNECKRGSLKIYGYNFKLKFCRCV